MIELKGIEFGLRAFAKLLPTFPHAVYEICGDGPLRHSLEALAQQLGISHRVVFHGAQSRQSVIRAMQRASVFLMPGIVDRMGHCEAQGLVLLEAQACELPVVASRVGGMPEVLLDGQTSYLVEPGNIAETAQRLVTLLGDRELRERFGAAGRRFVHERFDQDHLNARLLTLYEQLALAAPDC